MRFFCCLIISCLLCFWYVKCITQELGLWSVCDTILSSCCRRIDDILSIRRADSQKGAEAQPKKCPRELEIVQIMSVGQWASESLSLSKARGGIGRYQANLSHRTTCLLLTNLQAYLSSSWIWYTSYPTYVPFRTHDGVKIYHQKKEFQVVPKRLASGGRGRILLDYIVPIVLPSLCSLVLTSILMIWQKKLS